MVNPTNFLRLKEPTIYGTTWDWFNNLGGVTYIAHAILKNGVVALGKSEDSGGKHPTTHPDQVFWKKVRLNANRPAAKDVLRIEVDCPLMPCSGHLGCLYVIPKLAEECGYKGKELRIFSHRDEGFVPQSAQHKRVFVCHAGDSDDLLIKAFKAHRPWSWSTEGSEKKDAVDYKKYSLSTV